MQTLVFGTQAWLDAVKAAINTSPIYAKIMRNVRAAQELVLCVAQVPTSFDGVV